MTKTITNIVRVLKYGNVRVDSTAEIVGEVGNEVTPYGIRTQLTLKVSREDAFRKEGGFIFECSDGSLYSSSSKIAFQGNQTLAFNAMITRRTRT